MELHKTTNTLSSTEFSSELPARKNGQPPASPEAAARLIVLLPPDEFDETALALHVNSLAAAAGQHILFLALASNPEQDMRLRLRFKRLAILASRGVSPAVFQLAFYSSWAEAVRATWQAGDSLACLDGHTLRGAWFRVRSVAQELAALGLPISVVEGYRLAPPPRRIKETLGEVLVWAVSTLVIGVFFALQLALERRIERPLSLVLIGASLLVEMWLIAKVNFWK